MGSGISAPSLAHLRLGLGQADQYASVAVTNRQRIVIAGQMPGGLFSKGAFRSTCFDISAILNVSVVKSMSLVATIKFETLSKDDFALQSIARDDAIAICDEIANLIAAMKAENGQASSTAEVALPSTADEIMKFKTLLDNGIITQDEFDAKKRQLLGL